VQSQACSFEDLSSVLREAKLQPTMPKTIFNVKNTNTVFAHYATSWNNGTERTVVKEDVGVVHHYRKARVRSPVKADTSDHTLSKHLARKGCAFSMCW